MMLSASASGSGSVRELGVGVREIGVAPWTVVLGTTRWASPPPGISWRAALLVVILADLGLLLMALDVGLLAR